MAQVVRPPEAGGVEDWQPGSPAGGEEVTLRALRHQNELLRQTMVLCDRLTSMALRGAGIASITTQLSQMLGRGVTVLDPVLYPLASAGWPDELPPAHPLGERVADGRLRHALAAARAPLRLPPIPGSPAAGGCVVAPITVGARLLGHLAVASPEEPLAGDLDLFAVQHAATVYAQALLEEDRIATFRLRFKRQILETLLRSDGGSAEAHRSARLVGLDPYRPYQVVALAAHRRAEEPPGAPYRAGRALDAAVLDTVASALDIRFPELVTAVHDQELLVVAPAAGGGLPAASGGLPAASGGLPAASGGRREGPAGGDPLGARLLAFCHERFPGTSFTLGTSRTTTGTEQLASAWEQARSTRRTAERLGRQDEVTTYDDLGFYRLLLAVPVAELARFRDEVLGGLIDYDAAHHGDLLTTLEVYLDTGASPRHAAERLFVHPNTVVYRVGRIETIAGVDLTDPDDRLVCQAALKARHTLEDRGPAAPPGPLPAPLPNGPGGP